MKLKLEYCIRLSIITLLVISLLSKPDSVNAALVWEETFIDESYLENWWISHGNFTVQDGFLNGSSDCWSKEGYPYCINSMWKNHTAVTGTWSLDVNFDDSERFLFFYFMGLDITPDVCGCHPEYGFILIINERTQGKKVNIAYRAVDPKDRGIKRNYSLTTEQLSGWLHFDITRTEVGRMVVYLNGSLILDYTNNNFTTSEHVNIHVTEGVKLDNIKYSDSIDLTVPESDGDGVGFILVETLLFCVGALLGLTLASKRRYIHEM
ncbi:MAG: hypothetical protein ACFFCQ_07040 [Promethearchaeota archaeon]